MWERRWEQVQGEMASASTGFGQQLDEAHNRSAKLEAELHESKTKASVAESHLEELQKQLANLQGQLSKQRDVKIVERPDKSVEQQARAAEVTSLQVNANPQL